MERDKLTGIIDQKNEKRERDALRSAEQIIDAIATNQAVIKKAQAMIIMLREELSTLTVETLDVSELLG